MTHDKMISFKVSKDIKEKLTSIAKENNISLSALIRNIINKTRG